MITASLNQAWMYRGGAFTLVVEILQHDTKEPYSIPDAGVAKLRIAQTSAHRSSLLEKEASSYNKDIGIARFEFEAADTEALLAISYDLTIHLEVGVDIFPVFVGRFALVDFNPTASEKTCDRRNVELLIRRVREELRADGPDGSGYSDFIIMDAINSALDDLAGLFTIRDQIELTTAAQQNTYDLTEALRSDITDIVRVEYNNRKIPGKQIDSFLELSAATEGSVREWLLWGTKLILIGEVENNKPMRLWITRPPKRLTKAGDIPETPGYADEAIIAYAISVCYRESKDYERANYHYSIYVGQKNEILRKSVPQAQKDHLPKMRDSYAKPFRSKQRFARTDLNPGGGYR